MRSLIGLILILSMLSAGCASLKKHNQAIEESAVDTSIARTSVPASAPDATPGEPREEFLQEVAESQSPE